MAQAKPTDNTTCIVEGCINPRGGKDPFFDMCTIHEQFVGDLFWVFAHTNILNGIASNVFNRIAPTLQKVITDAATPPHVPAGLYIPGRG